MAVAELFALCRFTRGDAEEFFEDPVAHLGHGDVAVEQFSAIDVDVVGLTFPELGVGRQLDRWRRDAAVGRAAPGGETDQVGTSGDLSRHGDWVVAGGVHVDESPGGDRFSIAIDVHQSGRAAFRYGSERLLEDGRQPPGLVAGGGVVVHLAVVAGRVVLPPFDVLDDLRAHIDRHRPTGEQVLGSIDLGGLRQDCGAAVADQFVDGRAQRGVGRDTRVTVGAAALQADDQFRCRNRFPGDLVRCRQHLGDTGDTFLDAAPSPSDVLNVEGGQSAAFLQSPRRDQRTEPIRLAAEPDEQHSGDVGMRRVPGNGAA